jgi:hypothetical protein
MENSGSPTSLHKFNAAFILSSAGDAHATGSSTTGVRADIKTGWSPNTVAQEPPSFVPRNRVSVEPVLSEQPKGIEKTQLATTGTSKRKFSNILLHASTACL